jgi:hypothetical protein
MCKGGISLIVMGRSSGMFSFIFAPVLGFLLRMKWKKVALATEMKYFKLVEADVFRGTKILDDEGRVTLEHWLKSSKSGNSKIGSSLLFRGPEHAFRSKSFHDHCDERGPTVCIVKVGDNIFGGFTPVSNKFVDTGGKLWIFSLKNPSGRPVKFVNHGISKAYGMMGNPDCGPVFGRMEISLCDGCNEHSGSTAEIGNAYSNDEFNWPANAEIRSKFLRIR